MGSLRAAFALVPLLAATVAHADGLTIRVVGGGDWAHTVDELRAHGEPMHAVQIEVHDEAGDVVRCGDYSLQLDADGERAFFVGDCNPATQTTELCFTDRHYLYAHPDGIAQPIVPSLVARRPPPPTPPMPPPADETCWALVGPTLVDPETRETKVVSPVGVGLSFAATTTPVEAVAFDRGWLVRVPRRAGSKRFRMRWCPGTWAPRVAVRRGWSSIRRPASCARRSVCVVAATHWARKRPRRRWCRASSTPSTPAAHPSCCAVANRTRH